MFQIDGIEPILYFGTELSCCGMYVQIELTDYELGKKEDCTEISRLSRMRRLLS